MITPNLPTDNLYKFTTLFGILIFIAGFYLPEYRNDKLTNDYKNVYASSNKNNFEASNLIKKLSTSTNPDTVQITNKLQNEILQSDTLMKDYEATLNESRTWNSKLGEILTMLGIGFSLMGFYLWFNNFQIYQDIITKVQSGYVIQDWNNEYGKAKMKVRLTMSFVIIYTLLVFMDISHWYPFAFFGLFWFLYPSIVNKLK
jgi:hypothetical protein